MPENTHTSNPPTSGASLLERALKEALSKPDTPPEGPDPNSPACNNLAVATCCAAYAGALKSTRELGKSSFACKDAAGRAYRLALPPLTGADNIRDFVACAAYGMLLGAISPADGARLLYAAQVASSALQLSSPKSKRNSSFS
jgi:hypothetical protein